MSNGPMVRSVRSGDWSGLWPLFQAMGHVDIEEAVRLRVERIVSNLSEFLAVAVLDSEPVGYAWAHKQCQPLVSTSLARVGYPLD